MGERAVKLVEDYNGKKRDEEILKLPDLNNYSSDDETNINGEKDKNANAINYCENCAKCICRSWAALGKLHLCPKIVMWENPYNGAIMILLVELCPKTDIFITETDKK
ncbi:hypothetical protein PV325_002392 [Microctonus aethiopoides]|nr:hypothetical protein PV325_002392 [Microctonus aethiopoides]